MPNKPRPKVIVTRRLPQAVETRMAELFDVELNLTDTPFTAAQLAEAARNCDVLVPTVTDHVDAAVFAAAAEGGRLKLCANFGVGVDHIDLHAAHAAKVTVTNTPGVLTDDTADMVMALILGGCTGVKVEAPGQALLSREVVRLNGDGPPPAQRRRLGRGARTCG